MINPGVETCYPGSSGSDTPKCSNDRYDLDGFQPITCRSRHMPVTFGGDHTRGLSGAPSGSKGDAHSFPPAPYRIPCVQRQLRWPSRSRAADGSEGGRHDPIVRQSMSCELAFVAPPYKRITSAGKHDSPRSRTCPLQILSCPGACSGTWVGDQHGCMASAITVPPPFQFVRAEACWLSLVKPEVQVRLLGPPPSELWGVSVMVAQRKRQRHPLP